MFSIKFFIHYGLHFIAPLLIAYLYNSKEWKKGWFLLIATMLIDLDHLLASPIFDAHRCSIGFHPLHSAPIAYLYIFMLFFKKTRLIAIGVLFHLVTDYIDCNFSNLF